VDLTKGLQIRAASSGGAHAYTDLRAISLDNWNWTGGGTCDTSYGIYADATIDKGTTSYFIYSESTSPSVFTGAVSGPINPYGVGWDGSAKFATEDAVYDKIEALVLGGGGGVTVGAAVTGGTNSTVLYRDSSGNLGSDTDFQFDGTSVGIGTAPSAKLHVMATSVPFRVGYDASNYLALSVSSTGNYTFQGAGTSPNFTIHGGIASGAGGSCSITGTTGNVTSAGGRLEISGGSGGFTSGNGGDLVLMGGEAGGGGAVAGIVRVQVASSGSGAILDVSQLTADRTHTFPDIDGIIAIIDRDVAADWATNNPVPETGQPCLETDTQLVKYGDGATAYNSLPYAGVETLVVAVSDEATALTTGTAKVTFRMPFAMKLFAGAAGARASVTTAPTGAAIQIDINDSGSTIFSTELTIDATEKTSVTAATPPVISDVNLANDAEITIDIVQVGSTVAGAGLKVMLIGNRMS
jgi:hypothetical protein